MAVDSVTSEKRTQTEIKLKGQGGGRLKKNGKVFKKQIQAGKRGRGIIKKIKRANVKAEKKDHVKRNCSIIGHLERTGFHEAVQRLWG